MRRTLPIALLAVVLEPAFVAAVPPGEGTGTLPTFFVGRLEFGSNRGADCGDVGQDLVRLVSRTSTIQVQQEKQLKLEDDLAKFFKDQGLDVYTPDVDAFRSHVQKAYLASDLAKAWPKGMVDQVNAVK